MEEFLNRNSLDVERTTRVYTMRALILFIVSCLRSSDATHGWNYLMFAQSWPATVCRVWMESNSSHTCTFPQTEDAWSIHGIWPSTSESKGPEFCNNSWVFDPDEIKPIETQLEQDWINIENGTPKYDLWTHEWNKHGTCAAAIEPLNSQLKYFSQGLQWLQKYSMAKILSEANIVPSDTTKYSQNDFVRAVRNKLGVEPDINCLHDQTKQYLWELRICFSKSLVLIECESDMYVEYIDNVKFISNCNKGEIIYSESVKNPIKLFNQL